MQLRVPAFPAPGLVASCLSLAFLAGVPDFLSDRLRGLGPTSTLPNTVSCCFPSHRPLVSCPQAVGPLVRTPSYLKHVHNASHQERCGQILMDQHGPDGTTNSVPLSGYGGLPVWSHSGSEGRLVPKDVLIYAAEQGVPHSILAPSRRRPVHFQCRSCIYQNHCLREEAGLL